MTAIDPCGWKVAALCMVLVVGCGGAPKEATTANGDSPVEEAPASDEREPVQIEGILGTISRDDVERIVEARNDAVIECYQRALDVSEQIEGNLEVAFEVGADGRVTSAHLQRGTLGSREAESCILSLARRMVFPAPQGGTRAFVVYPLVLVKPYDDPAPEEMTAAQTQGVLEARAADVARCLGGVTGVQLTVYVGPKGSVISAGATADEQGSFERAQCLAEAAESWSFPPPGRNGGKATLIF